MTDKLFDNFISSKLKNYESQIPDGLWEKIILEEENKPKVIWWFNRNNLIIGSIILFSLFSIGYLMIENSNNEKSLLNINKSIANNTIDNTNLLSTNSTIKTEIHELLITTPIKSSAIVNKINIQKTSTNSINKISSINSQPKEFTNFKSNLQAIKYNIADKKLGINNSSVNEFDIEKNSKNYFSNNLNNKNKFNFYQYIQTNSLPFVAEINSAKNETLLLNKLYSGIEDCPSSRDKIRNDLYIEGYVSPDYSYKNVTSTLTGNDRYLNKKDSAELLRMGFSVGIRFSKNLSNNLLIKTGLQYSQINEKFTLKTENDRKQTIVINTRTIIRPGLADTTVSDTSITVQIGYRVRTNMNYYKNLEIPVILSYELSDAESKWKLAINGGAIINLTSWFDGNTIDASNNIVNIGSKANEGFYKSHIGISLYGALSILRNINDKVDVFAEPYFRYGLSNSIKSDGGFAQKFNMIGLQLGARIKLNNIKRL